MPIPKEWDLSGKSIILTTGSRGWAPIIADGLLEAGANLVLVGHNQHILTLAKETTKKHGNRISTIISDLTSTKSIHKAFDEAIDLLGEIDALVNDSQVEFSKPFLDITDKEFDAVMNRNVKSVFFCCQEIVRHMKTTGKGHIVNFCSVLAERGVANETVYSSSMAAIEQITRSLAIELAKTGINVNGIGTGWYTIQEIPLEEQMQDPLVRYLPSRRLGRPEEVLPLLVLLCSEGSSYLNGQTIFVDGGSMTHA